MRTIKISDQVWDAIAERGKFGETENDVLERVFAIEPPKVDRPPSRKKSTARSILPPEHTKCELSYGGRTVSGIIENNELVIPEMGTYRSFSKPACELSGTSLNGWLYWKIQLPGEHNWLPANDWRNAQKSKVEHHSIDSNLIKEKWYDVVLDVIKKYCSEQGSEIFTLKQLEAEKLKEIVDRTQSAGKTPQNSLQFYLQRLRDDHKIEFIDNNGTYRLRNYRV